MTTVTGTSFDTSALLSYYAAKQSAAVAKATSTRTSSSSSTSTTTTPWSSTSSTESKTKRDAEVLSMTDYVDDSDVPASAVGADGRLNQDNQKLFVVYKALDTLQYLASMAGRTDVADGVISGYNTRFQKCLSQIQDYISKTTFNNLDLQQAAVSAVATATASIGSASYGYTTKTLATSDTINNDLAGVSTTDSFTVSVTKNGAKQNLTINMADVKSTYGSLSISNIAAYVNKTLSDAGYSTKMTRVQTGKTVDTNDKSTGSSGKTTYKYGLQLSYVSGETVSFSAGSSSSSSNTALFLVGTSGSTTATTSTSTSTSSTTVTKANSTGRLVKLTVDGTDSTDSTTTSVASTNQTADTGTTTAIKSATDSKGNTYVIGAATGNIDGEINTSDSTDVYISKYDSAGTLLWSKLIGSSASATGYDLAVDPTGGVVVAGSTKSDLVAKSVANGNEDSFVAKFDETGNETWVNQFAKTTSNAATSVSVASDGTVTVGGKIKGTVSSSETSAGGYDAYLATISSAGKLLTSTQYGTSGTDSVAATTYDSSGNLYVASVENNAVKISKYAVGSDGSVDITATPEWTQDLGTLSSSGAISDIAVDSSGNVYVAGNTSATSGLATSSGTTVNGSSSGNGDAFVYKLAQTTSGSTTTASISALSYIGTSGKETAGTLAITSSGTVYLSGTTTGTFDGQTRSKEGTNNAFLTAIDSSSGAVSWTKQFGGTSAQSTGASVTVLEDNSSVLDALGLPTGTVTTSEYNSKLTDNSTVKAGDTFKIKVTSGSSTRTVTITIDKKETLNSLVLDINNKLGSSGKASVSYASDGKTLKLTSTSGYSLELMSGSDGSDALTGLGLSAMTLTDGTLKTSATAGTKTVYGLGLSSDMDFSTKTQAKAVAVQVKNVMSTLKDIYQKINAASSSTSSTSSTSSSGTSSAALSYLNSQSTDYATALSLFA